MEQKPSVVKTGLKYGLILGLILIAISVILNVAGLATDQWIGGVFSLIVFIGGVIIGHKAFKETGDGFMTYGQGLGIGVIIAAISSVISSVFNLIYIKYIDDSSYRELMDKQREQWEESGMTDAQMDQAESFSQSPVLMLLGPLIMGAFIGFILSLIISAFTKNNNPDTEI